MKLRPLLPALAACGALLISSPASAQGPLTPPGPPGAAYKTLDQLAPGIDVQTLPGDPTALHVISAPGSYVLSANAACAAGAAGLVTVAIAAADVTLDLRGSRCLATHRPTASTSARALWPT